MAQNNEHIVGPSAKFSEHKVGDEIRYKQGNLEKSGTIMHVRAPGAVYVGGPSYPIIYMVDSDDGFPDMVYPGEVIEE